MQTHFQTDIVAVLPQLRIHALSLTRNRADAEDLVQDSVVNALSASQSFIPGTHFGAWMHRIVRNRFISTLRSRRPTIDIDDAPLSALAVHAGQESALLLREVARGMALLPPEGREALELVALHGNSYKEISAVAGYAVGTGKSRVFRARRVLETWMETGAAPRASSPPPATSPEAASAKQPAKRMARGKSVRRPAISVG